MVRDNKYRIHIFVQNIKTTPAYSCGYCMHKYLYAIKVHNTITHAIYFVCGNCINQLPSDAVLLTRAYWELNKKEVLNGQLFEKTHKRKQENPQAQANQKRKGT